jgi:GDP-4-dehydro-6-deoxy-D-mannose reductase
LALAEFKIMSQPIILITGGTGFAGSHLVELLLSLGHEQVHVTSQSGAESFVSSLLPNEHIHQLDLTDAAATTALIRNLQPTQIYHLASAASVGNSFEQAQTLVSNHLQLQFNLLEAVRKEMPTARVLAIGSALEYDTNQSQPHLVLTETSPLGPVSPYAVSKAMQTLLAYSYAKAQQLDIVLARPFNHIGERQATGFVVSDFAKQIIEIERGQRSEILVGNIEGERDFTDVKDMVKAYVLLMEHGVSGEIYNIGSGQAYAISQILNWLKAAATVPISVRVDATKFRPLDITSVIADNGKIVALGWQPTVAIQPTVERVLAWWRQQ